MHYEIGSNRGSEADDDDHRHGGGRQFSQFRMTNRTLPWDPSGQLNRRWRRIANRIERLPIGAFGYGDVAAKVLVTSSTLEIRSYAGPGQFAKIGLCEIRMSVLAHWRERLGRERRFGIQSSSDGPPPPAFTTSC